MFVQPVVKPEFQFIAFFVESLPAYCDGKVPAQAAMRLSQELFGFGDGDFNPGHGGRYFGLGKYGYTFEVQVKHVLGESLAGKNHLNVYYIYE